MAQPRVAVVGGGLTGTLCSLVLKNRGVSPTLIDAGARGFGGRLRGGAQFLRATDPRLATVYSMLEQQGLLRRWDDGRFGVLGSLKGGFLPAEIVARGGPRTSSNKDEPPNLRATASDGGDFCHFADGSNVPTYVGVPSMVDLCPAICKIAGIQGIGNATVLGATPAPEGGWNLQVEGQGIHDTFDALVVATHDPSLAAGIVRSIAQAESAAGGEILSDRLTHMADGLQRTRDEGRMPVYTLQVTFAEGSSQDIPFDAVSVPGSHFLQFMSRSNTDGGNSDLWTAVSTSRFAAELMAQPNMSDAERLDQASSILFQEMSRLLAPYKEKTEPLQVFAKRWGAAFTNQSLNLQEDCVSLEPWRLTVCGDFIRDLAEYSTPSEAAALSGLEAGERTAAFFAAPAQ